MQIEHVFLFSPGEPENEFPTPAAVIGDKCVEPPVLENEAVNKSVLSEKAVAVRNPIPVGRTRKSSSTSDTSIEDIEPVPKQRRSLRTRASKMIPEQKVLRSRTVSVASNKTQPPKGKQAQKRRISKVVDKEDENGVKCDVISPPPARAQSSFKTTNKDSGSRSRATKKVVHQDDVASSTAEELSSPRPPTKVTKVTKRLRRSQKAVKPVGDSKSLIHSSVPEPDGCASKCTLIFHY